MDAKMAELGDVQFIINLGDSFYPCGVIFANDTDPQWKSKWRDIYSARLRSVPWYSVYGNHDNFCDYGSICGDVSGSQGAQINGNVNDLNSFYMPSPNWYKEHPELGIEVVALDMNIVAEDPCAYNMAKMCESTCRSNLEARANTGEALLRERLAQSSADNLVVFSHYPTDYFSKKRPSILTLLEDDAKPIVYFGGHRHNTDQSSTADIGGNTNWLVGGGGGYSCDGGQQGFVVGEIRDTLTTYAVYADQGLCTAMESTTFV